MLSLICVFSSFSISAFEYDYDDYEIVDEDAVLALCHNPHPLNIFITIQAKRI